MVFMLGARKMTFTLSSKITPNYKLRFSGAYFLSSNLTFNFFCLSPKSSGIFLFAAIAIINDTIEKKML